MPPIMRRLLLLQDLHELKVKTLCKVHRSAFGLSRSGFFNHVTCFSVDSQSLIAQREY